MQQRQRHAITTKNTSSKTTNGVNAAGLTSSTATTSQQQQHKNLSSVSTTVDNNVSPSTPTKASTSPKMTTKVQQRRQKSPHLHQNHPRPATSSGAASGAGTGGVGLLGIIIVIGLVCWSLIFVILVHHEHAVHRTIFQQKHRDGLAAGSANQELLQQLYRDFELGELEFGDKKPVFAPGGVPREGKVDNGNIDSASGSLAGERLESVSMSRKKSAFAVPVDNNFENILAPADIDAYREESAKIKEEFALRYGGEEYANEMLKKGIITFEPQASSSITAKDDNKPSHSFGLEHTAQRIINAISSSTPFVFAFGGYSVTVGRGNYFNQSFPFVLERIIKEPMKKLGISDLIVRNAAVGGIPSFPYGWCMDNFLGNDADVISWDFAMNEGNGAEGLERYIRQSMTLPKSPMFILLDAKRPRLNLLQSYVNTHSLPDAIAIQKDGGYEKPYMDVKDEKDKPIGFQEWNAFGAPRGSPGQSSWHPKYKQHELIGWLLAIHFIKAMDIVVDLNHHVSTGGDNLRKQENERKQRRVSDAVSRSNADGIVALKKPIHLPKEYKKDPLSSLLYGFPISNSEGGGGEDSSPSSSLWSMNNINCRSSFQYHLTGSLQSVITSGLAPPKKDVLESDDEDSYSEGWIMAVGKLERDTKRKLVRYGGLGYIDMKTALYGLPSSGTLELWLPLLSLSSSMITNNKEEKGLEAKINMVKTIVVCEVNEKRGDSECNMMHDISYKVGGVAVSNIGQITAIGTSYLKKPICVYLDIPSDAKLTKWNDVKNSISSEKRDFVKEEEKEDAGYDNDDVGITLDVTVTNANVTLKDGPCSISHIVWEEKEEISS